MRNQIITALCFLTVLLTGGFTSSAQEKEDRFAKLSLEFRNIVGDKPLQLRDQSYINEVGEKFNITTFNYFISNIKLLKKNGEEYVVPRDSSYFLVKEDNPDSRKINLKIPKGKYAAITFTIGVDSLRSTMDISRRTGALDISGGMLEGMYWTWNSGYIFMKMEGECEQAVLDRTGQKKFRFHIGGYGGYNKPSLNNIRTVTIDLLKNGLIKAKNNKNCKVLIEVNALQVFNGKNKISIAKNSSVMFSDQSKLISENYTEMFSHISTKN